MKDLDPNKTGLALGALIALWHFVWGLFVAFGFAQWILDFVYSIHFLNNPFTVSSFDVVKWVTLVAVTFVVGYIFGFVFANLWNKLYK